MTNKKEGNLFVDSQGEKRFCPICGEELQSGDQVINDGQPNPPHLVCYGREKNANDEADSSYWRL